MRWNYAGTICVPEGDYVRMRHPGLALRLKPETLGAKCKPRLYRPASAAFLLLCAHKNDFYPQNQESAGLTLLMNSSYHLRMECVLQGQSPVLRVCGALPAKSRFLAQVPLDAFAVELMAVIRYQRIAFYYASVPEKWQCLYRDVDGTLLCKETAGGYTGTYLGLFASSGGQHSQNEALFDWFEYQSIEAL
jgi:alpha-N-arabinofuranosidase